MKDYTFVSGNGIEVEVTVTGAWDDAKDFAVSASNGWAEDFEEIDYAGDITDAMEDAGIELGYAQRHFVGMVIEEAMITEGMSLGECLEDQAAWEAELPDNPVADYWGKAVDFDAAAQYMDGDLREDLHNRLAPCSNQKFFEAYAAAHADKFGGEEWAPYYNGEW